MSALGVDQKELTRAMLASGIRTHKELALRLGVDPGTVSRVLAGKAEPGPKFITACLAKLPTDFDSLFTIEEEAAV